MGKNLFLTAVCLTFLYSVHPMVMPVLMGAILAILFYPVMEKFGEKFGSWRPSITSAVLSLGVTVLILFPAVLLGIMGGKLILKQFKDFEAWGSQKEVFLQSERVQRILDFLSNLTSIPSYEIIQNAESAVQDFLLKLVNSLTGLATQIPGMLVVLAIMVLSQYFFFIEGGKLVEFFKKHSVLDAKSTRLLIDAAAKMVRSVMTATFLSAVLQSLVFMIVLFVCGVGSIASLGFLAFVFSFVPLVGSLPVIAGVGIYEFLTGHVELGMVFLVSGVLISIMDNVVRAMVMRGAGNLHPLLAFVGAFGGVQVLGPVGIFLGPILAGIFMTVIQILVEGKKTTVSS